MPFSIELYFKSDFEQRIFHLWSVIQRENLPSRYSILKIRPHLTLAVFEKCAEEEVIRIVNSISQSFSGFEVEFPAVCVSTFDPRSIFLMPSINKSIDSIREVLIKRLIESKIELKDYYLPGRWLPHCTVSKKLSLDQSRRIMGICQNLDIGGNAEVIEIGFVHFNPRREIMNGSLTTLRKTTAPGIFH